MTSTPSPEELRAFLQKHNLTGRQCAELVGVKDRQVRRWTAGDSFVPYAVWYTLNMKVEGKEV